MFTIFLLQTQVQVVIKGGYRRSLAKAGMLHLIVINKITIYTKVLTEMSAVFL